MAKRIYKVNLFLNCRIKLKLLVFAIFISPLYIVAQEHKAEDEKSKAFRLMFYNVENYFDPFDDTLSNDNEFLPEGIRNWNYSRFLKKRNNIYKTIMAVGGWEPPAIIGLCEIENRFVLNQLVYQTPFAKFDYRIIHEESPDRRGIDVALLFNPKTIQVIDHKAISIDFPFAPETKTRDILYVKGLVYNKDTLHIFVNHWPSRYGGELSSKARRVFVAQQLANHIDALLEKNNEAAIVVMGDFNDYSYNQSIKEELKAGKELNSSRLLNLMPEKNYSMGTYKFDGEWGILDQIMVSPVLLLRYKSIFVLKEAQIFDADFLLQEDAKYLGDMPHRTFLGMKYIGGFSDHLPVFVDFRIK
ncbi:MAG: endonuclease [Bacteroidales bacterium]|jgi:predicted extracellular nuclease|nr:endonuclease [Bacteroidales bacterium]